jgi:hypothetical protein
VAVVLPDITVSHGDLFSDMVADIAGSFWYLLPVSNLLPPFCLMYEAALLLLALIFYSDFGCCSSCC